MSAFFDTGCSTSKKGHVRRGVFDMCNNAWSICDVMTPAERTKP